MDAGAATFPAAGDLRGGDRSIELRSAVRLPSLASGGHEIAFTNNYRGDISVYLANALKADSPRIVIASQKRDETQHALAIDFTVEGEGFATLPMWGFGAGMVAWLGARRRFLQPAAKARAAAGVAIGQSAT